MRAALDACIYETACHNTGMRPPPNEGRLEFPVCTTPTVFRRSRHKIALLTERQVEIVESVQPYNAPQGLEPAYMPFSFNRALGILHDWARKDRHRRLHVAASWASNIRPLLKFPEGARSVEVTITQDAFILHESTVVATFKVAGWRRGMTLQANPNLSLDLAVDEPPLPCHDSDTLDRRFTCMKIAVRAVVDGLADTVGHTRPRPPVEH